MMESHTAYRTVYKPTFLIFRSEFICRITDITTVGTAESVNYNISCTISSSIFLISYVLFSLVLLHFLSFFVIRVLSCPMFFFHVLCRPYHQFYYSFLLKLLMSCHADCCPTLNLLSPLPLCFSSLLSALLICCPHLFYSVLIFSVLSSSVLFCPRLF